MRRRAIAPTVSEFIEFFENRFGAILGRTRTKRKNVIRILHFEMFAPKKRYSDWDLECRLKPGAATIRNVKAIDRFVTRFSGFAYAKRFLTFSKKNRHLWQHIDRIKWLQFMAFMPEEKSAPFFDLHINGVGRRVLKGAYGKKRNPQFLEWAMLTSWRKLKNNDRKWAKILIRRYVLPSVPGRLHKKALADPARFFGSRLKKYELARKFLK